MIDAQRDGVFLAHIPALLIDNCQPVCIRVLAKTNVSRGRCHFLANAHEILRGGLWSMNEMAAGHLAETDYFTTESFQQADAQNAPRAGVAVQQNAKVALGNRRCV